MKLEPVAITEIIILFFILLFALNWILFQPLLRVMAERSRRTDGMLAESSKTLQHYTSLFEKYQNTLREARLESYRHQEQLRAEALKERARLMNEAKGQAERMISEARDQIHTQVERSKGTLTKEAKGIAGSISQLILQRRVAPVDEVEVR